MPWLSSEEIGHLVSPFFPTPSSELLTKLGLYLDLLLKWNARTNLTAIREPTDIVRRHFGESLFASRCIGTAASVLDFGSGAGFPGIPIALVHPSVRVTLAESQNKKASFLREVTRELKLNTSVWAGRVEEMPAGMVFDCVALRAVDSMAQAMREVERRCSGSIVLLSTLNALGDVTQSGNFTVGAIHDVPDSKDRVVAVVTRS